MKTRRVVPVLFFIVIALALVAVPAYAGPGKSGNSNGKANPVTPHSIIGAINAVDDSINALEDKIDQLGGSATLEVEVVVNETVCTGLNSQCSSNSGSGHTTDAASSANHNPVAVYVYVKRDGQGVAGLPGSAFVYDRKFTPAAGPGVGPCIPADEATGNEAHCGPFANALFQDAYDGVYAFYVHPTVQGFNWHQGMYTFLVHVEDTDGTTGAGLGKIVIPE